MATKEIFLSGKCKWAHTAKPDKFGNFSVVLYPDQESLNKINTLKEPPAILNQIKKDEDGYNIKLSCPQNKTINGKVVAFNVAVLKADGMPLTETLIGNGSDITAKCDVYTYRRGEGRAVRLKAIRVDNLIPFVLNRDFADERKDQVSGVMEQPVPLF